MTKEELQGLKEIIVEGEESIEAYKSILKDDTIKSMSREELEYAAEESVKALMDALEVLLMVYQEIIEQAEIEED